jgi:SAM-dependent methyltransferase
MSGRNHAERPSGGGEPGRTASHGLPSWSMASRRRFGRAHTVNDDRWDDYLASFHRQRAGITEAILCRSSADDGSDPYGWLLGDLPADGVIVDVACGSAPLAVRATSGWIGLDRNRSELDLAVRVAPGRVLLADATAAPFRAGAADAVVCSMALMLVDDPGRVAAEIARLLRGGGRLVALLPATAPLTPRDRARYARLLAALRLPRLPFRHHRLLDDPLPPITAAGLTLVSADRRRFAYPLTGPSDAVRWLRSLYLPGLDAHRWRAAQRVVTRWTGSSIGVPLRRLVATKAP